MSKMAPEEPKEQGDIMKPAGSIKWILGVAVTSCLALVSMSRGEPTGSRVSSARADDLSAVATPSRMSETYVQIAASGPKAYRYQYFPDAQVYFDPIRELFFYMFNGEWTKSPALPRELRNRLGDFVMIETDDDDPYGYYRDSIGSRIGPDEPTEKGAGSKTHGGPAPSLTYQYYYYPRDQVYFDPANHDYFYFSGSRWQKSPNPPPQLREPLGDFVIIETDTDSPYIYHGQVLHLYFEQTRSVPKVEGGPPAWEPGRGDPVYRYLYYPAAFVYFDEDRRVYFYFDHNQWEESRTLPAYLSKHAGSPVELRMKTPEPYQFHEQVTQKYPHPGVEVNKTKPIFQIWSGNK
jgi:hypothetical protein